MDLSFVSYNRPLPRLKVNCLKHLLRNSFANINDILDSDLTLLFKDQTLQLLVRLTELNVDVRLNFLKVVLHITLQLDDMVLHFLYLQLQRIQIVFILQRHCHALVASLLLLRRIEVGQLYPLLFLLLLRCFLGDLSGRASFL